MTSWDWDLTVRARLAQVLLVVLVLTGCTGPPSNPAGDTTREAATGGDREDVETAGAEAVPGLMGVDVGLANAVAPYDAYSEADAVIVGSILQARIDEFINECVRAQGVTPVREPVPPPHREALIGGSRAEFPHIESLARDGVPVEVSDSPLDPPVVAEPPGYAAAEARCAGESRFDDLVGHHALYVSLRSAWQDVLADIETTPEIRSHASDFSDCLRDQGIPAEGAADAHRFFAYVDGLLHQAAGDTSEMEAVGLHYGQMYVECGRDLFEARERLRGGEWRATFLAEHAGAMRELSDVLYGAAGDGSP